MITTGIFLGAMVLVCFAVLALSEWRTAKRQETEAWEQWEAAHYGAKIRAALTAAETQIRLTHEQEYGVPCPCGAPGCRTCHEEYDLDAMDYDTKCRAMARGA